MSEHDDDGSRRPEPGEWFLLAGVLFYRFHGSLRMRVGNLGHCFQARRCLSGSIDPCDDDEWVRERDISEVYASDWMAREMADALDVEAELKSTRGAT